MYESAMTDLLESLERGATVLTPGRHLSRVVTAQYNHQQLQGGRSAWPSPNVLPLNGWLMDQFQRLTEWAYERTVLTSSQELALWQRIIRASRDHDDTWDVRGLARLASDALRTQVAWRIDTESTASSLSQDRRAFARWCHAFKAECGRQGWLAPVQVADEVAALWRQGGIVDASSELIFHGFDTLSTQDRDVMEALRSAGMAVRESQPGSRRARSVVNVYPSPEDELRAVAAQVRELLQADSAARIGVVLHDLASERQRLMRIFDDELQPARVLEGNALMARPYTLTDGVPLSTLPAIETALQILALTQSELPLRQLSTLLQSPYIAGWRQERSQRAALDALMRQRGGIATSLQRLQNHCAESTRGHGICSQLTAMLTRWATISARLGQGRLKPSQWVEQFAQLLDVLGWPGDRPLDHDEHEAVRDFEEVMRNQALLDVLASDQSFEEASQSLRAVLNEAMFQTRTDEATVHILNVTESVGMQFDHLFVLGMHDEAWPQAARANALLPLNTLRAHAVPHASTEWELAFAQRMMQGWECSASQLAYSFARQDGDTVQRPCRFLQSIECAVPTVAPIGSRYMETVFLSRQAQWVDDAAAPGLPVGYTARGGARLLKYQSVCPFRAYASERLEIRELENERLGLDARERGILLHQILASFYGEIDGQEKLLALGDGEYEQIIHTVVEKGLDTFSRIRPDILTVAFRRIESMRLTGLVRQVASLDVARPPFRVLACEEKRNLDVSGLKLNIRVDRIDESMDGGRVIFDYKTSEPSISHWFGERPEDPQIPLYGITDPGPVDAVAYVAIRTRKTAHVGLSRQADLIPDVSAFEKSPSATTYAADWSGMLSAWRVQIENLAQQFLAGDARVAPKQYPDTCRDCGFSTLCRVKERFARPVVGDVDD